MRRRSSPRSAASWRSGSAPTGTTLARLRPEGATMETKSIKSADGTAIAFETTGEGPPLILVGGAFCDRSAPASGTPLAALLAHRFTVLSYDRRGRGDSQNTPPWAIDREIEDLSALIAAAGGSAFVFGNSSGGLLALDAAARGLPIPKLA